jgi:hypothetical protein
MPPLRPIGPTNIPPAMSPRFSGAAPSATTNATPPVAAPTPNATPAPTFGSHAAPVTGAPTNAPRSPMGTPTRVPINPFLANDPNAKARRLARALISDLVTYFPQRRDEGLRDGTLKELFRDEIKKSYEEFVDQVGREFADSTQHFNDALNDILASGQMIF